MKTSAPNQFDMLKQQPIDDSNPGTVLRDFQTVLDFVGTGGIKTGGKNYRLPLAALSDLDERMTDPLRPRLARPQQVSFPHLNGLYLLLRATALGISSGEGSDGRLSVNPDRLAEWGDLNPEERYFTLFQAMLTAGWCLIDSGRSSRGGVWQTVNWIMHARKGICQTNRKKGGAPASDLFPGWTYQTVAALLELFGILEIERVAQLDGENWRIKGIQTTAFGTAFLRRLSDPSISYEIFDAVHKNSAENENPAWLSNLYREFFPNCVHTLSQDEGAFVDGVWQFKVSLGNVWRRIVIPAELTADELVGAILAGFKFDNDHLYELQLRSRSGRSIQIGHPELDDVDYYTDEFAIGRLPIDPGQSLTFLFDFGDTWKFTVKLEKILPLDMALNEPQIIARHGKAPRQYGKDGNW